MDATKNAPKVKKESKNKIKVEFEGQLSTKERLRLKIFSMYFLQNVVVKLCTYILLVGISYVIIYPFISKIATSIMCRDDFVDATVLLISKNPTLETYRAIIVDNRYFQAMLNTALLSLSTAVIQMFITCLIGYGFAKFKFRGNGLLFLFVIMTMVVPHSTIKLALYMKFRYFDVLDFYDNFGILHLLGGSMPGIFRNIKILPIDSINMTNSYLPFIVLSATGLAFKNGLYIFMLRQFFRGVPDELEESAYIDGAGTFRTFVQIILPLSVPMLVTVFMFAFSWQWTDTFYTDTFFTSTGPYTLRRLNENVPRSLDVDYAGGNMFRTAIGNACGILIMLPLVIIYCFAQKYLVQGIERSGITG